MSDAFRKMIAAKYPGIKVLDTQMEGFEPSAAEGKAVAILQGNADVNGAFSTTGAPASVRWRLKTSIT